ncbi:MAG: di-trans,poly-cis-decaprenylcistransferase [Ruminococcus sp.]|nr:di-trans,poly-cis-decaprenylcistransferase [Candidatus Apopatosoma intestinale]
MRHIAFIMDGNGRWAKARLMPREFGHKEGAKTFRRIARHCLDIGLEVTTVYAFSTENWKRPESEVAAIMGLLREYIDELLGKFKEENARVVFLGNKSIFPEEIRRDMTYLEECTKDRKQMLCIAVNYGGRAEITDAVNALIAEGKTSITEEDITSRIDSGICPPPDMIIRTGREKRLSNFLTWQSVYSELVFSDTLWPDFSEEELDGIIRDYQTIHRRFGGI